MNVGTRSVLYGVHCWCIHPWFVALAWWRLYGFPFDPRLWVGFFVHDLGYWGKPNMDGEEGEQHPVLGAKIMHALFDWKRETRYYVRTTETCKWQLVPLCVEWSTEWYKFALLHSRYFAKRLNKPFSRLCVADKLALVLTPRWLYLRQVRWSGEVYEYMAHNEARRQAGEPFTPREAAQLTSGDIEAWYEGVCAYTRRWVEAHKDGSEDTFTPKNWRPAA